MAFRIDKDHAHFHSPAPPGSPPESVGELVAKEAMDIVANGVSVDEVVAVQKATRASLLVTHSIIPTPPHALAMSQICEPCVKSRNCDFDFAPNLLV